MAPPEREKPAGALTGGRLDDALGGAVACPESSTVDRRLGARVAFGPAPGPELLDWLDRQGHDWLMDADTPLLALTGGLAVRVARLERALATLAREIAA